MNKLQFIALLTPSIGSLVLVILAWMHSNSRITRLEHTIDAQGAEFRAEIRGLRAEFSGEISAVRGEISSVRGEISSVRGEIIALREIVYSEMVSLHERVAVVEAKLPR